MSGLFRNSEATREGKYPVLLRRDGSVPEWEWFVLGQRDPAAPAGIRAYADAAEKMGFDPIYVADLRAMADAWGSGLPDIGHGDPDAPPHRTDDPDVLEFPESLAAFKRGERGRSRGKSA